jgi:hypothetical protein
MARVTWFDDAEALHPADAFHHAADAVTRLGAADAALKLCPADADNLRELLAAHDALESRRRGTAVLLGMIGK